MNLAIQRAIFATNAFSDAFPEAHLDLWKQFVNEVPSSKRSGSYAADSVAYIKWLIQTRNPLFVQFTQTHIDMMEQG